MDASEHRQKRVNKDRHAHADAQTRGYTVLGPPRICTPAQRYIIQTHSMAVHRHSVTQTCSHADMQEQQVSECLNVHKGKDEKCEVYVRA